MTQSTSKITIDAAGHWQGWSGMTPTLRLANFYDAEPGGGFGPRYITEYQLIFVQRGSGEAVVDDQLYQLSPGDVLYYGPPRCNPSCSISQLMKWSIALSRPAIAFGTPVLPLVK
jgi:hypothetical protein